MKIIIIGMIFLFFLCVAIYLYLKYLVRYRFYKDMVFICGSLKNNINFNMCDIDYIFNSINESICKTTKFLFNHSQSNIFKILNNEEKRDLTNFITSIGCGDIDYENRNISYFQHLFEIKFKESKEDIKVKGSTYLKVFIAIGIIVCIVLI